ncbi:5-demethoxyubiquinol-8 5-hydroxylase UbiM [Brevundimonas mediterranea]|uniref:Ubiquinone biosynthesis UbiH/UbiF/VisC/COQ6 family hydroxylase n=1 Tax=Brevundimonas mediterranea TaxID=74329 RepID=A0A7W6A2I3_9CAUL|nr:5-demethoxyubiquinol-8 5-hydroxylase UbiM [Brevundimonas mediterranea]MBB3871489.1 ubiquinone biosynthesis UbiH/UbiF/VisC/COQ6 family hydroxylase [Brevundimonas mediterranea]
MRDDLMFDVAVVGAGPAGLAFTRSLAGAGLTVAVIEGQDEDALRDPAFDGREIALTHNSIRLLKSLGAWDRVPAEDISDLREARVLDGGSPFALTFDAGGADRLGVLIPNHLIRRALFEVVEGQPGVTLMAGRRVASCAVQGAAPRGRIVLDDGATLRARLIVAADSRFSGVRDQLGVGVEMTRLGRSMMVCRMRHDQAHGHVATEWFDHRQTVALLPVADPQERVSSVVLTLAAPAIADLMRLSPEAFAVEMERRLKGRLTGLELIDTRHAYPLATTWSRRFAGEGFALIGDAAVGMHPVTAHGFNLGLRGQDTLAKVLKSARGGDIGAERLLARYEREHRLASWPLYQGTNALVRLFTEETPPARLARGAALRAGQATAPFKRVVKRMLTA